MILVNSKNKNIANELADKADKKTEDEFDVLLSNLRIPSGKPREQVWQSILEKMDEQSNVKIVSISRIIMRVAASIVVLIAVGGATWIWGFNEVTVYSPKGQHVSCLLPDSSSIQLNADTRISYNKVLWIMNRKVYINGEALFKVRRGKKFDVIADLATTSVLGTTFDVYARNGKVKVSCIEGRVSVKSNSSDSKVVLTAGLHTQTKFKSMTAPVQAIKHDEVAWTFGEFYFSNTPLSEVIREIERQFNVEVISNCTDKRFYTGYFNNKDLNDALRLVCVPMEMSYCVNKKSIEIKQTVKK